MFPDLTSKRSFPPQTDKKGTFFFLFVKIYQEKIRMETWLPLRFSITTRTFGDTTTVASGFTETNILRSNRKITSFHWFSRAATRLSSKTKIMPRTGSSGFPKPNMLEHFSIFIEWSNTTNSINFIFWSIVRTCLQRTISNVVFPDQEPLKKRKSLVDYTIPATTSSEKFVFVGSLSVGNSKDAPFMLKILLRWEKKFLSGVKKFETSWWSS